MLRLVLSPRWIAWHLLTLGAMVTCAFLAGWQWHRAGSAMGSALNVGYGLQWPLFAVFFGFMWWHFLHMEVRAARESAVATTEPERPAADPAATVTGAAATAASAEPVRPPAVDTPGPVDTSGPVDPPGPVHAPESGDRSATANVPAARSGPSPFGPRPAGVEPSRLSDPQLRAYNDALARLAARDQET